MTEQEKKQLADLKAELADCKKVAAEISDFRAMKASLMTFVNQVIEWNQKFENKHWK